MIMENTDMFNGGYHVQERLLERIENLEAMAGEYETKVVEAAVAEVKYKNNNFKLTLEAMQEEQDNNFKRTVAEREAVVGVKQAERLMDYKVKEALAKSCKEALTVLRTQCDADRSVMANTRGLS